MVDLDRNNTSNEAPHIPPYLDDISVSKENGPVAIVASYLTGRLWNGILTLCDFTSLTSSVPLRKSVHSTVETDSSCSSVEWVSENRLVVGSDAGTVDVWSWDAEEKHLHQDMTLAEHHDVCSQLTFNTTLNQVVSGSWDKSIKVWDLAVEMSINTLRCHCDKVLAVAWSEVEPHLMLSASQDGKVILYDNSKAKPASVLYSSSASSYPTSIHCSPTDGNIIVIGHSSGMVSVHDTRNASELLYSSEQHHTKPVNKALLIPSSPELLATCSDDCSVSVVNWKDGSKRFGSQCHTDYVRGMDWDASHASLVTCGWDGAVMVPFNLPESDL